MKSANKAAKNRKAATKKLSKDVIINHELDGKYDDQPLFQDKVNRANHILKTVGLPKFKSSH